MIELCRGEKMTCSIRKAVQGDEHRICGLYLFG